MRVHFDSRGRRRTDVTEAIRRPRPGAFIPWATLACVALLGPWLAGLRLEAELEPIRGARVALEARSALEGGARPQGDLTIVRESESAKYPFLNKRSYLVHTASAAREGTALRASDPADKARADRHSEARRKRVLRERLEDGSWRVTIAGGATTVELVSAPDAVRRTSPWLAWLGAFLAGALVLVGATLRRRRAPWMATVVSALTAAVVAALFGERAVTEASLAAIAYLAEVAPSPPVVTLPRIGVRATIAAVFFASAGAGVFFDTGAGKRALLLLSRDRAAYVSIAPAIAGLFVLVGVPFAFGIGLSFFDHVHGKFTFVGLENFARILHPTDRPMLSPGSLVYALLVNVLWMVSNVSLHVTIGLFLALLLQRSVSKVSRLYRALLIVPWAVPAYLTALIWKSMFDADVGAVNRLLGLEGMSWMHRPVTAFLTNLITNVWLGFPFMMVVCLGALASIPKDLYEAADVDGASARQQLFRITLPLLKPALLPAVILGSIWTFNRFEVIYLVSEGRPDGATDILVTEAYRWAFERGLAQGGAYGYAAAYSVVIFLVLLLYGWMTARVARAAEEALR